MAERVDVPAVPAATVILVRDTAQHLETLLLRRNSRLAFHGGAWVFPGGRVDTTDYPAHAPHDLATAARYAAVREAQEEAGLDLRPEALVPFSHWTTPLGRPQRFATWFFLAAASDAPVHVDGGEIHAHQWMQPDQALSAQRAGQIELPPPTFVTLTQLTGYQTVQEALTALTVQSPETFFPRTCPVPDGSCALYTGDAGYDTSQVECSGPRHRLWMLTSGWRYERSIP